MNGSIKGNISDGLRAGWHHRRQKQGVLHTYPCVAWSKVVRTLAIHPLYGHRILIDVNGLWNVHDRSIFTKEFKQKTSFPTSYFFLIKKELILSPVEAERTQFFQRHIANSTTISKQKKKNEHFRITFDREEQTPQLKLSSLFPRSL